MPPLRTELINTGSEILFGSVLNTHLRFLAQALFPLGIRIDRQITVPDGPAIRTALAQALSLNDLIIVTGGLGPTSDDLTRDIAAELLGLDMREDPVVLEAIRDRFRRRNFAMPDRVNRQALVPEGAVVLANPHGTAPGIYFPPIEKVRPHIFLLPGPPRELQPMVEADLIPRVRDIIPAELRAECRIFRVLGLGESAVEASVGASLEAVPELEIGYCARPGEVDIRLIGSHAALKVGIDIVHSKLQDHIFSESGDEDLEAHILNLLASRHVTLAVAESCTGGALASRITDVPGASLHFLGGFVTYSNELKVSALGVDPQCIVSEGAVSEQVACAMAAGAAQRAGADYALSTTGIAGPEGGTEHKPVGTVFIGLKTPGKPATATRHQFASDRATFKFMATQEALNRLRLAL